MNAPFTIDAESGMVRFPDLPLELRPLMSVDEFIAASSRMNRDNLGTNDGWQRYQLRSPLPGSEAGDISCLQTRTALQIHLRMVVGGCKLG